MKKNFKATSILLIALCLGLLLSGCGEKKQNNVLSQKAQSEASMNVYVTIDYPEEANLPDIVNHKFPLDENASILTSLQLFGILLNIPVLVETTNGTVVGINGINEDSIMEGVWVPVLNDEELARPYSTETLSDGDTIKWLYKTAESTEASQK